MPTLEPDPGPSLTGPRYFPALPVILGEDENDDVQIIYSILPNPPFHSKR